MVLARDGKKEMQPQTLAKEKSILIFTAPHATELFNHIAVSRSKAGGEEQKFIAGGFSSTPIVNPSCKHYAGVVTNPSVHNNTVTKLYLTLFGRALNHHLCPVYSEGILLLTGTLLEYCIVCASVKLSHVNMAGGQSAAVIGLEESSPRRGQKCFSLQFAFVLFLCCT